MFLSPSTASKADDPKLADKESILASLNLKAMSFDDAVGLLSESTRNAFAGLDFTEGPRVERRGSAYGCNVPIITEVGEYEGSPFFRACSVRACSVRACV